MPDDKNERTVTIAPALAHKLAVTALILACFNPFLALLFLPVSPVWPTKGDKD